MTRPDLSALISAAPPPDIDGFLARSRAFMDRLIIEPSRAVDAAEPDRETMSAELTASGWFRQVGCWCSPLGCWVSCITAEAWRAMRGERKA